MDIPAITTEFAYRAPVVMPQSSSEYYPSPEEELDTDISDLEIEEAGVAFPYNDKPIPKQEEKSFKEKFSENIWYKARIGGKCLLVSSCLFAVMVLAFECILFALFARNLDTMRVNKPEATNAIWRSGKRNAVATYLALYIYAEIYQVLYSLLILYTKSVYHLVTYNIFLGAMAVYSGIQYYELRNTLLFDLTYDSWQTACTAFSVVVICLSCLACLIQLLNARYLWKIFIKSTGEKVGNKSSMVHANTAFNLNRNAIILGVFFFPAFTLQFAVIVLQRNDPEFIITIVILALSYFVLLLSDYCAVREKPAGLLLVFLAYLCGLAYLSFKLYRLFTRYVSIPGKRSLIAFDIFCMVLLLWLLVLLAAVWYYFGNGIKEIYSSNYRLTRKEADTSKTSTTSFSDL